MTNKTAEEIMNVNWSFNTERIDEIRTAAMVVAARELQAIRRLLESVGQDGIHQVIREYKQQVPIMRAKRLKTKEEKTS